MGYGAGFIDVKTMASADSIVSFFDLQRPFQSVYLQIPSMPSSTSLDCYGSLNGVTFYQVRRPHVATSTIQINTFIIAATCAANGSIVPVPGGFRYYKFVATDSAPTAATTFKLIGGDS